MHPRRHSALELLGALVQPAAAAGLAARRCASTGIAEDEAQAICDRIAAHYVPWQEARSPACSATWSPAGSPTGSTSAAPTASIDAACASSLAALSIGVDELQLGQSDLVITGGVDTFNDIFMYMCFSKTPALSPTGDCRPFADRRRRHDARRGPRRWSR